MPFYNREEDIRRMKALLSGEPNLVWFVYGPINSGKTALLIKVFEKLPENYRVFYINFRGRDVEDMSDLMRVLFRVKGKGKKLSQFLREVLKSGANVLERIGGIPIPEGIFDLLFRRVDKVEDVFAFLEDYFKEILERGYQSVLVFDEMQTIKEIINTTGRPVIGRLFNFLVRLTKETHLCHCLFATSDCLFIEDVYNNARLEGRAKYILVDDLDKEEAFRVYDEFGFRDKELCWEYIGGKLGDMVILFEGKKQGYSEKEALNNMLKDEIAKLRWIEAKVFRERKDAKELWEFLKEFKSEEKEVFLRENFDKLVFWIKENILFYNPVKGTVRFQGKLLQKAARELLR